MIHARAEQTVAAVADHYDELDVEVAPVWWTVCGLGRCALHGLFLVGDG
jgi:hypothetical protein